MAWAQLFTNNGIPVTIQTGASLTVLGDISVSGTTLISNNGNIRLSGNWINNSGNLIFGTSSGTVLLNGITQTLGGTSPTLFHNLTLNGTTEVTLLNDIAAGGTTLSGILDVANGVLRLNSHTLHITNAATNGILSGSGGIVAEQTDNSSRVLWDIGSAPGAHQIPFINNLNESIPVVVEVTAGDVGTVQATTYVTSNQNLPFPSSPEVVTHVKNTSGLDNSNNMVDRFWYLDKSGTGGVATITFTFGSSEVAGSGNLGPRAQRWSAAGDGWFAVSPGQNNPTALSTRIPGVNVFGTWALANEPTPLPIELLYFNASLNEKKQVDLHWITSQEINNDYFTVEKSRDGLQFENLMNIPGAGNSFNPIEYLALDPNPFPGISYYRLKQTDYNGTFSYSGIRAVNITGISTGPAVYPNPVSSHFYIQLNDDLSESASYTFLLYDAAGRVIKHLELSGKESLLRIDRNEIAAGMYQYNLISRDGTKFSGRIMMD